MNEKTAQAVKAVRERIQRDADVGIVLGSGLGSLVEEFRGVERIGFEEIPNFPISSVAGHTGEIVAGSFAGGSLLALSGRIHFYEGHPMRRVVFPIKVLAALGVKTLIVTNAAGAINESYTPGDIVIIKDHINMMGDNPLRGAADFVDMTDAYANELRELALDAASSLGVKALSGVYIGFSGPAYETPAEIRAFRILGGDLVGMSTVPEVIQANSLGVKVLGLSMVTNMASGITGESLTHKEVLDTTEMAAEKYKTLVTEIIQRIRDREERDR
ncbi:MAG: purine-nucleoside phosphorylase [Desulfobacterales bacterium]|nr:purine-nucleoside phosphorylase [Desulfobacterales bacterium]